MARRRERVLTDMKNLALQGHVVDLATMKQVYEMHGVPFENL